MDKNYKEIIENFEASREQLKEALNTINDFSRHLREAFKISADVQSAINKSEKIDYVRFEKAAKSITDSVNAMTEMAENLEKLANVTATNISDATETISNNSSAISDSVMKNTKVAENLIEEVKTIKDTINESVNQKISELNTKVDMIIEMLTPRENSTEENTESEKIEIDVEAETDAMDENM